MAKPVFLNERFTLVPLNYEARSRIIQKDVQLHSDSEPLSYTSKRQFCLGTISLVHEGEWE